MCFGGSSKMQSSPVAPVSSPLPSPTPTTVESAQNQDERRRKIAALRYGMMSTIKTGPQGISGTGPNLNTPTAAPAQKAMGA